MRPRSRPHATLQLICFPYAGGGSAIYSTWLDAMPEHIEVCPVKLPGREDRLFEQPHNVLDELLAILADELDSSKPYAFFGHSMGAMLAYELARSLRRNGLPLPVRLLISGHRAPQLPDQRPHIYHLPDDQFIVHLINMNGTPREVVEHRELIEMLLPALRADFTLCDTYTYLPDEPLDCSISAFGGIEDRIANQEQMEPWREHTRREFKLRMFPGGHFFLHTVQQRLVQAITEDLTQE